MSEIPKCLVFKQIQRFPIEKFLELKDLKAQIRRTFTNYKNLIAFATENISIKKTQMENMLKAKPLGYLEIKKVMC